MRADRAAAAAGVAAPHALPPAMPAVRPGAAAQGDRGPWARGPDKALDAEALAGLAGAAVRRLAALRRAAPEGPVAVPAPCEAEGLCTRLVRGDAEGAADLVRRHCARDGRYACLSDGLLADAARRLGAGWDADSLSVIDVSVAVATLLRVHAILRSEAGERDLRHRPRVLFIGLSGQAHTLGILLAAEAFRREGWDVALRLGIGEGAAIDEAGGDGAALVGLSAGRAEGLERLCGLAERLRRLPDPPGIIVGGAACSRGGAAARGLAADCVATRIDDALSYAREVERRLC